MAGTGPVPNPNSRRQAGRLPATWVTLPADGWTGPIPDWPLSTPSPVEAAMWARYWRKPQAAAWDAMGMVDEVAIYVRMFLAGSGGDVKATTEARQWVVQLGLTPAAMLKNRWRMGSDEVATKRTTDTKTKARRRIKVTADDALAETA